MRGGKRAACSQRTELGPWVGAVGHHADQGLQDHRSHRVSGEQVVGGHIQGRGEEAALAGGVEEVDGVRAGRVAVGEAAGGPWVPRREGEGL